MKMISSVYLSIIFAVSFGLSGCGAPGLLSNTESFQGGDTFEIATVRPDILEVIAAVGEDMGMSVGSLDKNTKSIGLGSGSSMLSRLTIGSSSQASLTIRVTNEGKRLDIHVLTMGNFGSGGQAASTKLVEEFKTKLAKRLDQKIASK